MSLKQHGGFTLIEVSLFLAVSGLLLLIGIFGMGPQLKKSQFTDSMQGIGSYINSQYNEIQTGVNSRKSDIGCTKPGAGGEHVTVSASASSREAGSGENCVLLGRHFEFSETGIKAKDVVGSADGKCAAKPASPELVQKLEKACATVVDSDIYNSAQSHSFSWGNKLQNGGGRVQQAGTTGFTETGSYDKANAFGIYRNPDSSQIFTVLYGLDGKALPTNNINAQFCFEGQAPYPGAVYFGGEYNSGGDTVSGTHNLVSVKVDDDSCNRWTS